MVKRLLGGAVALALLNLPAGVVAQPQSGAWPRAAECSNINPSAQRGCIGRRVQAKDRMVEQLYPQALSAVQAGFARWGRTDSRLHPRHFAEAHRDWRRFIASNCRAVGAFGGGSNSSVSDRITACSERELDERIQLYRQIADGSYGR